MYFGCDLSIEEYAKDFEKLGYAYEEAVELAKNAIKWFEETKELKIEMLDEEIERIGCTSFRLTYEELRRLGIT